MESGAVGQVVPAPEWINEWVHGAENCVTPDGGIALYRVPKDDHDNRTVIFEFSAAGRFQRRTVIEQKYFGSIVMAPDDSLWVQDAWMSEVQRVSPSGVARYPTAGVEDRPDEVPGNTRALATSRDGSLAMTGNGQMIRAELADA